MNKSLLFILAMVMTFLAHNASAQNEDTLKTTTIKVANLHCNNDMPTIKKQLQNQEGIEEITFTKIEGDKSIFTISYHSSAINESQIEQAIEGTPGCDDKTLKPYKVKKETSPKKKKRK